MIWLKIFIAWIIISIPVALLTGKFIWACKKIHGEINV